MTTLIDANVILRYLLHDNEQMFDAADGLISTRRVEVRYEVAAEVVYVLGKIYALSREEIADCLRVFLGEVNVSSDYPQILNRALETFANENLDFVDCLLYAFNAAQIYDVFTFDKKLNKLMSGI